VIVPSTITMIVTVSGLKALAVSKLGGHCVNQNCGRTIGLTIHHVKINGAEERRTLTKSEFYLRIIDHPEDYQLLCATCHLERYSKDIPVALAMARARGVKLGSPVRIDYAKVRELRAAGQTQSEVAEALNISVDSVKLTERRARRLA
jgi:hypothetical protein